MDNLIDTKTVEHIAHLARLDFDDASAAEILNDMNRMLHFIDTLNELDTDSIEPLIYMTEEHSVLREDEPGDMVPQKEALKNAPRHDSDYFKAPKVIGEIVSE